MIISSINNLSLALLIIIATIIMFLINSKALNNDTVLCLFALCISVPLFILSIYDQNDNNKKSEFSLLNPLSLTKSPIKSNSGSVRGTPLRRKSYLPRVYESEPEFETETRFGT
jgi:hypothetical protein